jgi:hypothetical protein
MARLRFQSRWIGPILDGRKVQTLRRPARLPRAVLALEIVEASSNDAEPPFARLQILSIDRVYVSHLAPVDATREGLETLSELRAVLRATYGTRPGKLVRIRFRVI